MIFSEQIAELEAKLKIAEDALEAIADCGENDPMDYRGYVEWKSEEALAKIREGKG